MTMRILPLLLAIGAAAQAQTPAPTLAPPLQPLGFLVGHWSAGQGTVVDTGGTSTGESTITSEVGGTVLIRRDHTELRDAAGKAAGGFDQIMMIYPEGGTLHADYSDGTHIIHYTKAETIAGKSVTFTTGAQPGPSFRLSYALANPATLAVTFAMAPPGSADFHPIASGTLTKAP